MVPIIWVKKGTNLVSDASVRPSKASKHDGWKWKYHKKSQNYLFMRFATPYFAFEWSRMAGHKDHLTLERKLPSFFKSFSSRKLAGDGFTIGFVFL